MENLLLFCKNGGRKNSDPAEQPICKARRPRRVSSNQHMWHGTDMAAAKGRVAGRHIVGHAAAEAD